MYRKLPKKKKPKLKAITRIKWEETKIETNRESIKKAAGRNSSKMVNSAGDMNSASKKEFRKCSNFLVFSALLSFWSLTCNAEFDSNSSCLDRLNNFGTNSLQKLQN